jgi:hypothetical protein
MDTAADSAPPRSPRNATSGTSARAGPRLVGSRSVSASREGQAHGTSSPAGAAGCIAALGVTCTAVPVVSVVGGSVVAVVDVVVVAAAVGLKQRGTARGAFQPRRLTATARPARIAAQTMTMLRKLRTRTWARSAAS